MSNTTPFGYPIPTARRVSPLRQRMIEDMTVRNLASNTQDSYLQQVSLFARHFNKSPEELGPEEIRAYQVHLTNEKKLAHGSILIAVAALRCVRNAKQRTILTTCYATGLRISEVVHLKPTDIDSKRMVIRVDQGKGQK